MRKKSKKVKRRAGRIVASVFGWLIVASGLLALAFVACAYFGVAFPSAIENLSFFEKIKSNAILSVVATVAFSLLGLVVLLSVRVIVKDERDGLIDERNAYDARQQAIREVNASLNVIADEDDERAYEGDFMPPSCLIEETRTPAENDVNEEIAKTFLPAAADSESDKTVVPVKSLQKKRKHKRRPNQRR